MNKFRARQLDASRPISIWMQADLTEFNEQNNVTNRTVPQLPTGMEKEEETEHHLQQAIYHQRVIPVPEVFDTTQLSDTKKVFDKIYPPNYKIPRQLIHIHPFSSDHNIPDYDLDSEDEEWLENHASKGALIPLDHLQFEEIMDRLEGASGLKAVTLQEAKCFLHDDDDLITAVYDYWLNKRLQLQHPLIPQVRSEKCIGSSPSDPYVAFRKRTEKMQTRKNRKNDEASYEKMLYLKRNLIRAKMIIELVRDREKEKRDLAHVDVEVYKKRFEMEDFAGIYLNEIAALRSRLALITNQQTQAGDAEGESEIHNVPWRKIPSGGSEAPAKRRDDGRKRAYRKKRKLGQTASSSSTPCTPVTPIYNHPPDTFSVASVYSMEGHSSEDEVASHSDNEEDTNIDGPFAFRRKAYVTYHAPRETSMRNLEEGPSWKGTGSDPQNRYSLTSVHQHSQKFFGMARRRVGRGGRIWLDRSSSFDERKFIKSEIKDNGLNGITTAEFLPDIKKEWPHFHPSSPAESDECDAVEVDVETITPRSTRGASRSAEMCASFYITAEMLDGHHTGALSLVEVTSSSGLGPLLESQTSSVVLEENGINDVDLLSGEGKYERLLGDDVRFSLGSVPHSSLDFQTTPSSRFIMWDKVDNSPQVAVKSVDSPSSVTEEQVGTVSVPLSSFLTSCSTSSVHTSSVPSLLSPSLQGSVVKSKCGFPATSPCTSSSSPLLSTNIISVSSSSATSLSNSMSCASPISVKYSEGLTNSSSSEYTCRNATTHSSIFVHRQTKDSTSLFDSLQASNNSILSNSKGNSDTFLSNSNLVQKKFTSWTNENMSKEETIASPSSVISNGPSTKSIDKTKCSTKVVSSVLFSETGKL